MLRLSRDNAYFAVHILINAAGRILMWLEHGRPVASIGNPWKMNGREADYISSRNPEAATGKNIRTSFPDMVVPVKNEEIHFDQYISSGINVWLPVKEIHVWFKDGAKLLAEAIDKRVEVNNVVTVPYHPRKDGLVLATIWFDKNGGVEVFFGDNSTDHAMGDRETATVGGRSFDLHYTNIGGLRDCEPVDEYDNYTLTEPDWGDELKLWVGIDSLNLAREVWAGKRTFEDGPGVGDDWSVSIWHPEFGNRTIPVGFCFDLSDATLQAEGAIYTYANKFNYINDDEDAWQIRGLYCTDG